MRDKKKVTIYDIARRLGTSPSTVGSVMNGSWQNRRISAQRAEAIKKAADEMGYSVNLQASALRRERSSIVGMIVPMHDNRYFSSISQAFEAEARRRKLFPVISSTLRDPDVEESAVRQLLDYQVELIVCTGASDPDTVADLCQTRGVPTYNLDLPGTKAPSVISDNYGGARRLADLLLTRMRDTDSGGQRLLFIGGRPGDHNTQERVRGFRDAHGHAGLSVDNEDVLTCGYAAQKAKAALEAYVSQNGGLPAGLFVNSTISLEGVLKWFHTNGMDRLDGLAFGCFDWDPFASLVHPDLVMVRQNVEDMVARLFDLIDQKAPDPGLTVQIPPVLMTSL